ncbi:MCE family protein [Lampropedia puyangensis]|uniref:MCE family protein n=1 Tax=Lampropedia puyangensis TaxID=1330072 RepID=A0A4S8F3W4_9BURK|nr:MlaD family protein [Lampropedia puyangensis]THU02050.1 MCE family protein [Lampropedia puyangensis]
MSQPSHPAPQESPTPAVSSLGIPALKPVAALHIKSLLLMVITTVLTVGAFAYVLYARGVFEEKQTLVLTADDSEGVAIGMDLTFSGFPIGKVRQIELADDGTVRFLVDVPKSNAHRLRESSIFTMVRNILGTTSLKAYTSDWDDPPLQDNATRSVLFGDASAEIPQLMASARSLINNLSTLTASDSELAKSLASVSTLGSNLNSSMQNGGLLKVLVGDGKTLEQLQHALSQVDTLMGSLNRLSNNANHQVFGQKGLMQEVQAATQQLTTLLTKTQQSLAQIDTILSDVKTISGNVSESSGELDALRSSVESNLRQIDDLMAQIQSTWPFAKDHRITLP